MLVAVVAYAKLHAPALLHATSAQQACDALHAESCLRPALWMRTAYAMLRSTPDHFFPRWAPFSPLPAGPIYPRRVEFPKSVVGFGFAEVARIKASEAELMQRRYLVARVLAANQEAGTMAALADERRRQMEAEEVVAREALAAKQALVLRASRDPSVAMGEAAVAEAEAAAQRARAAGIELEFAHAQRMSRLEAEARAAEAAASRRSGQHTDATKRAIVPEMEAAEEACLGSPRPAIYEEVIATEGEYEGVEARDLAGRERAHAELEQLRQTFPSTKQQASSTEQQATSLAARRAAEEAHAREARVLEEAAEPGQSFRYNRPAAALGGSMTALAPAHVVAQAPSVKPLADMGSAAHAFPMPEAALLAGSLPKRTHSPASIPSTPAREARSSPALQTAAPHLPSVRGDPRLAYGSRHCDATSRSAASDDGAELEELLRALRQQRAEHAHGMELESEAVLKRLLLQHGIATASAASLVAPAPLALAPEGDISPIATPGAVHMSSSNVGPAHSAPEQLGGAHHLRYAALGANVAEPRGADRNMKPTERLPALEASPVHNSSAQQRPHALAGPLAESTTAGELIEEHVRCDAAVRSTVCGQHEEVQSSGASEPSATFPADDSHASVPPGSPTHTALRSSMSSTTHGLQLDGLGSHLRARLALEARAGRESAEYQTPGVGSTASGGNGGELDALRGLRLSGLPTGLQRELRGFAEEGRALGLEMADTGISSDQPGMPRPQSSMQQAAPHPRAGAASLDPLSGGQVEDGEFPDASPCATCELLADQFDSHEAWVESLRAKADAVLATHLRAQEGLASLMSAYPSSGDASSASEGLMR